MTLQDFKDLFLRRYQLESRIRNASVIEYSDKEINFMISEAQQRICLDAKPIVSYTDISLTAATTYTTYSLPSDWGEIKENPTISGEQVDIVGLEKIPKTGNPLEQGQPTKMAVYHNGTAFVCAVNPLPNETYTMRVFYYSNSLFYAPSGASAQDWGTFDGEVLSGNIAIPDKYIDAMLYFMLSIVFKDLIQYYQNEINKLKSVKGDSSSSLDYSMGGY